MKTTKIALFMAALMFAPSAFAYEITPYVGLGIVVDKANTSAKRLGFDKTKNQINLPISGMGGGVNIGELVGGTIGDGIIVNGGGDMAFDAAFAGEITAGVRIDNVRLEFEAAFRSASEDSYNLYDGNFDVSATMPSLPGPIPFVGAIAAAIETSTSVRHDSYLFNMFYDFNFGTRWTPYVGAGIGFGRYQQETSFNYNADLTKFKQELGKLAGSMGNLGDIIADMPDSVTGSVTPDQASHDLYRFEWQVSAGVAYNFDEDWVLDLGYRFNSATVGGEFVYAHEVKLGARYMF